MPLNDSHARNVSGSDYVPPRHAVLLLSCMDPRLMDDLTMFMHRDNLTNRYDHVILAGAALGALQTEFPHWRETFLEHMELAVKLHDIKDVFIVEHRNCGAYAHFLGHDYGDTQAEQAREEDDHRKCAFQLRDEIHRWCAGRLDPSGKPLKLKVHCFLMDMRGAVKHLCEDHSHARRKPDASRSKTRKSS